MYERYLKDGLINKGNVNRIKYVMNKAYKGLPITTLFLGGSITQGARSSKQELCYASLVHKWWKEKFPLSDVKLINAGIGGTTSQFGASRVRGHVLKNKPDFVLTEFAVNDENEEFFKETYEGLVRAIISDENEIALLLMNNAWFDSGKSAEDMHRPIAEHYDLPMISMKSAIFASIKEGNIVADDISPDMLHPNDEGHKLVAAVIIDFLDKVYDEFLEDQDRDYITDIFVPQPLTANQYENSVRIKGYNMSDYDVKLNGFIKDEHVKRDFLDIFSNGFCADKVNDSITFTTKCTGIAVQYKKTVNLPAPIAKAVVDGDEGNAVVLDANFDETWGDCLYIETVAKHLPYKEHTVTISLTDTHEEDKFPFYLVSVIVSC